MIKTGIGKKIYEARLEKGFTQTELAKLLQTKQAAITNWERNINKPEMETIIKLSKVLNKPISYFIDDDKYGINTNINVNGNKIHNSHINSKIMGDNVSNSNITTRENMEEIKERLLELKKWFDEKIIDEKEYQEKRKELLRRI